MFKLWQITAVLVAGLVFSLPVRAEIKIAVIAPSGQLGNELAAGAALAVEEFNQNGGVNGKRLSLLYVEDPCDDILSMTTAEMIALNREAEQRVDLVIGPYCANRGQEIADLFRKNKIFQILPLPVSSEIYGTQNAMPLRFLGYSEKKADVLFDFYRQRFAPEPFAFVYDNNNPEAVGLAKALLQKFEDNGWGEQLQMLSLENYGKNVNKLAKNVAKGDVGAVYLAANSTLTADIAALIRSRNQILPILGSRADMPKSFVRNLRENAENTYRVRLSLLKDNPYFAEELVRLRLKGTEPEGVMPYTYLAVRLAAQLWNEKGKTAYEKIAPAAVGNAFEAGWGAGGYKNGVPAKAPDYVLEKFSGGEYTQAN